MDSKVETLNSVTWVPLSTLDSQGCPRCLKYVHDNRRPWDKWAWYSAGESRGVTELSEDQRSSSYRQFQRFHNDGRGFISHRLTVSAARIKELTELSEDLAARNKELTELSVIRSKSVAQSL